MKELIKSISYDQSEIIKWILDLHVKKRKIDCDPTYSIGNFYKNTGIQAPLYKFDINPQISEVEYGDSRKLPLKSESIDCEMFDPPFLATTGNHYLKTRKEILLIKDLVYILQKKNCINFT